MTPSNYINLDLSLSTDAFLCWNRKDIYTVATMHECNIYLESHYYSNFQLLTAATVLYCHAILWTRAPIWKAYSINLGIKLIPILFVYVCSCQTKYNVIIKKEKNNIRC